jgi:eukaryotic translation initiation factor 2C
VQKFFEPSKIENWAVVNFSARCDVRGLVRDLIRFGEMKGIVGFIKILCTVSCNDPLNLVPCPKYFLFSLVQLISDPVDVVEENGQFRRAPPLVRVEKMFEQIQKAFPNAPPRFLVCLLPDRKNSDIYG